jgi:hypothetical protein
MTIVFGSRESPWDIQIGAVVIFTEPLEVVSIAQRHVVEDASEDLSSSGECLVGVSKDRLLRGIECIDIPAPATELGLP